MIQKEDEAVDHSTVVSETRNFNDKTTKPRHAASVLTSLLYLLGQGEVLTRDETESVFFNSTKLWNVDDLLLHRLLYVLIKDLRIAAEDAIIVTQSLTKDMNGGHELLRPAAIRTLVSVCDPVTLQQLERFLKTAIVDKSGVTSSAALVAAYRLMRVLPDLPKRWLPEINEALSSRKPFVQYHAAGLLFALKRHDRTSFAKVVAQLKRDGMRSQFAYALLLQQCGTLLREGGGFGCDRTLQDFVLSNLERTRSDMVTLEAARVVASVPGVSTQHVRAAVTALGTFLSSHHAVHRLAACRTLQQLAVAYPELVAQRNGDLELLCQDQNRSVATLALTTLLRTGQESSLERLLKQINTFLADVTDDFKAVIVESVTQLSLKFPAKYDAVLTLFGQMLNQDGKYEFKRAVVAGILAVVRHIEAAREQGLQVMCEFIEDCDYVTLMINVLNVLGDVGPRMPEPAKYVRCLYNRIILESAQVRGAAADALAQFGERCPSLRPAVLRILERSMTDTDDEVRDRATLLHARVDLLARRDAAAAEADSEDGAGSAPDADDDVLSSALLVPLPSLTAALREYLRGDVSQPFDVSTVEVDEEALAAAAAAEAAAVVAAVAPTLGDVSGVVGGAIGTSAAASSAAGAGASAAAGSAAAGLGGDADGPEDVSGQLTVPVPSALGPARVVRPPRLLTENDSEIRVVLHKVLGARHVCLVFEVTNTLDDMTLGGVAVTLVERDAANPQQPLRLTSPPVESIPPGQSRTTAVMLTRPAATDDDPVPYLELSFGATMSFVLLEEGQSAADMADYAEEYTLEAVEIGLADMVMPYFVADFAAEFAALPHVATDTFAITTMRTVYDAVTGILAYMGLAALDGCDVVAKDAQRHECKLAGRFGGEGASGVVLAVAKFAATQGQGIALELTVKSRREELAQLFASCVA